MSIPKVSIRPAEAWVDYIAAEEIQNIVWQMKDATEILPAYLLKTAHQNGGLLLGAFVEDRMIGFVFGFIGIGDQKKDYVNMWHCSNVLAVLPEYQNRQVGEYLKFAQREYVLNQGIDLITWTFDPLQAKNAHFNLHRLGVVIRYYFPNMYGELTDSINAGLPSDRFKVEWWLNTVRVKKHALKLQEQTTWNSVIESDACTIFDVSFDSNNFPHIEKENELTCETILVDIPHNISILKDTDPALAKEWRARTRDLFQRSFKAGYTVVDFAISPGMPKNRAVYILTSKTVEANDNLDV